jgi:hypothetical protein
VCDERVGRTQESTLNYVNMPVAIQPPTPRTGILGLSWRQLVGLIALGNAFVATYLHLWKIGKAGSLACGGGGGCALA